MLQATITLITHSQLIDYLINQLILIGEGLLKYEEQHSLKQYPFNALLLTLEGEMLL